MSKSILAKYAFKNYKVHYFDADKTSFFELDEASDKEIKEQGIYFKNRESNPNSILEKGKYDIIIGIAMYAEEYDLIDDTLEGINQNLDRLVESGFPYEKILTIIISDGIEKVNREVYDKFIKGNLTGKTDKIHEQIEREIFSDEDYKNKKTNYLISCLLEREHQDRYKKRTIKMDLVFSLKKHNRGKLDSHFWLFMGFCMQIDPKYIILLDTGTIPDKNGKSLSSLIMPMINDKDIAGTCGEMRLSNTEKCLNFTLTAQFMEYKYSHIVDKHFESLFGFVSVLPGAFSAYRWEALNNNDTLGEYFKTIDEGSADCAMANRYLAEDRIFCFILFCLKEKSYTLKFIPDALAATDAPEYFGEFMLQRRRWINGSNFALYYVLGIYQRVWNTNHRFRQVFIFLLFLYYGLQAILSYFVLGTFYFVYYLISFKQFSNTPYAPSLIMAIYLFVLIFCMICAMTIKPKKDSRKDGSVLWRRTTTYKILSFVLGFYNLVAFFFGIYTIIKGGFGDSVLQLYNSYQEYLGAMIMVCTGLANFFLPLIYEPSMIGIWLKNFVQYLFFQPTYSIIFNVFAVCNIDDVSWGNRDSSSHLSDDTFKLYKVKYLFLWLVLNFIQGYSFSYVATTPSMIVKGYDKHLINGYSYLVTVLTIFKLVSAVLGKLKYVFIDKCCKKILDPKKAFVQNTMDRASLVINAAIVPEDTPSSNQNKQSGDLNDPYIPDTAHLNNLKNVELDKLSNFDYYNEKALNGNGFEKNDPELNIKNTDVRIPHEKRLNSLIKSVDMNNFNLNSFNIDDNTKRNFEKKLSHDFQQNYTINFIENRSLTGPEHLDIEFKDAHANNIYAAYNNALSSRNPLNQNNILLSQAQKENFDINNPNYS